MSGWVPGELTGNLGSIGVRSVGGPYGKSALPCPNEPVPDNPGAVSVYGVEISEEEFSNRCGEKP